MLTLRTASLWLFAFFFSTLLAAAPPKATTKEKEDEKFRQKLTTMLAHAEKSEKLLRQQIVESANAPFLPDLYLQLAQLLSEKSNTLYYIQMEKQKGTEALTDKEASPVLAAQKEAITVYRLILKDFPKFDKRKETLYRLALALKSIDESVEFIKVAGDLVRDYPNTEESMGARLLLGQHFFDKQLYKEALDLLNPITKSKYVYERNLATYRIGLIYIAQEQFAPALTQFEKVVQDDELKEQDNPYNVSLKAKRSKSDLKREALIDSIRAYTRVYEKNPEPVVYYSKLAPTEIHFQEVIEKLALRYIHLKKYDSAIKLLRTLSERTVEPQKILNIYHDVLLMIPVKDRVFLPVDEMRFLLEKYNLWTAYYTIPPEPLKQSFNFLEKQVRELGTTSHSMAKEEKDAQKKTSLLRRSRDYYLLYLAFFRKTNNAVKMATNLADVYFALNDFPKSGDYYLRTFQGEFGKAADKKLLVENAILCFQKKGEYSFYDNLRLRGLLIKAIESYLAFDKKMKTDPALNFLLVKSQYEQGFFPESLAKLEQFAKTFAKDKRAIDAGELILDYYNTRNDFGGLEVWSGKLLALKLPHPAFNEKLGRIKKQAKAKFIHEKVRSLAGYDDFSQGKSYLSVALSSGNEALKDMALQEALAKSKRERDIQTFLKAASLMADKEKKLDKKADILKSVAREYIKVTQYYKGIAALGQIHGESKFVEKERMTAYEEALSNALVLRDWTLVSTLAKNPLFGKVNATTTTRMKEQLGDLIESPVAVPPDLVAMVLRSNPSDATLLSLYKGQYKLGANLQKSVLDEVRRRCGKESKQAYCLWSQLNTMNANRLKFLGSLKTAPESMESIQTLAPQLMQVTGELRTLENSGDPQLDVAVAIHAAEVFTGFGEFLGRAAAKNADLKTVLLQKSQETLTSAKQYRDKCKMYAEKGLISPATKFCASGTNVAVRSFLEWPVARGGGGKGSDPTSDRIEELQRTLFAAKDGVEPMLGLAKEYYDRQHFRHATAAATYGMALYKSHEADFRAILGCSVLGQGFFSEASFHLKNASEWEGLRDGCLKSLEGKTKDVG